MKIVFFGSDDFAAAYLEHLIGSGHEIAACVTPPDRPRGRGMKVSASPVKELAEAAWIQVLQPDDLKEDSFIGRLKKINCDFFIVIAYGKILPPELLDIPGFCAVNVHPSLLPKYRGAAPINWAIINGEKKTGISIIRMNAVMDGGDILDSMEIDISDEDTSVTLKRKMIQFGPEFLLKSIDNISKDRNFLNAGIQDGKQVTFAPKLTKESGHIKWDKPAVEIHNSVRGLLPWPAAYTYYKGKMLKILFSEVVEWNSDSFVPGQVVRIGGKGLTIFTGKKSRLPPQNQKSRDSLERYTFLCDKKALLIKVVHLEASRPMGAQSFIAGHKVEEGFVFE